MQPKLSRRKIARYAADAIVDHGLDAGLLETVAAYLVDTRRVRETELVVRAIQQELVDRGVTIAEVTSAYPLDQQLRERIQRLVGTDRVYLREIVDPSVLGGVRIDTPGRRLDATIRHRLTALRALTHE